MGKLLYAPDYALLRHIKDVIYVLTGKRNVEKKSIRYRY